MFDTCAIRLSTAFLSVFKGFLPSGGLCYPPRVCRYGPIGEGLPPTKNHLRTGAQMGQTVGRRTCVRGRML